MEGYEFTNQWFITNAKKNWDKLIPTINPSHILEVGSYEGMATCYLIEKLGNLHDIEIDCVDSWEGGFEHSNINMGEVEKRFLSNIEYASQDRLHNITVRLHKGKSDFALSNLCSQEQALEYYDFIYIDGSHEITDVLFDAVAAFRLLRIGGVMCFDDYKWRGLTEGENIIMQYFPKLAIDAFTNIYAEKIEILPYSGTQLFVKKLKN